MTFTLIVYISSYIKAIQLESKVVTLNELKHVRASAISKNFRGEQLESGEREFKARAPRSPNPNS